MVKWIVVKLTDREYEILETIDELSGDCSQKFNELFTLYLQTSPRFKANYHLIKLDEQKDFLLKVLSSIWSEYEESNSPMEGWDEEKVIRIRDELLQVNAIQQMGVGNFIPTSPFKKPWLSAYHKTSIVFPDIDEFSQACISTIYILNYLSRDTFELELLRDATIILNENYMFVYATAKKRAHEFSTALENRKTSTHPGNDLMS